MDLAAGMMTPEKGGGNDSVDGIFGMDDNDVAPDGINHGTGNNYGFDSFDDGIKNAGNENILDTGFV